MPRIFRDQNFRNELLSLAFPVIGQEILVFLANTINALIVNIMLGKNAFNGTTSAGDIFGIFNTLLMSFVFAGAAFSAQFIGKKDKQSVRKIFNLSLKISLILALIFMTVSMIWPTEIISGLTGGQGNIEFGANYLRVFSVAFIFRGLSAMYYYSLKNAKKTKLIITLSLSTFALNAALTAAFCSFQIGDNPSVGPAIAAVSARGLEFLLLVLFTRKLEETKFSLKYFLFTEMDMFVQYMRYTVTLLISRVLWGFGNMLMSKMVINNIEVKGDPTLTEALRTANNTVATIRSLVNCSTAGVTAASSVLIGRELGANKLKEANAHSKDIMHFLKVLAAFNIVMSFAYAPIFIYTGKTPDNVDPERFATLFGNYVWMFSGIYALSYLAQVHNATINDSFFTGGGDKVAMFIANGLFMWCFIVPLGMTAYYCGWHPILVFTICTSEELVKCWAIVLRYYQRTWVKNIVDPEANKMMNFEYKYIKAEKKVVVTFDYKTINKMKYEVKVDQSVKDPIKYTQELLLQRDANKQLIRFANQRFKEAIN